MYAPSPLRPSHKHSSLQESVPNTSEEWRWVGEWTVDLNGLVDCGTDLDGWMYAVDFRGLPPFVKLHAEYNKMAHSIRRRRWVRLEERRRPDAEEGEAGLLEEPEEPKETKEETDDGDGGVILNKDVLQKEERAHELSHI